jgi:ThiF family
VPPATWDGFARGRLSVTMSTELHDQLSSHLNRSDGQEDLCFVLWRPSIGRRRASAIVVEVVLPQVGERHIHGNASFEADYLLRAASIAANRGCGLGFVHNHPGALHWQGLSADDASTEAGYGGQVNTLTGLPFLGMTLAGGDHQWSARVWKRSAAHTYEPRWCETVRVVGNRFKVSFNPELRPPPAAEPTQLRTVEAWGPELQADLARLRIGIVGAGSVGALIAEALARTGVVDITLIDYDTVERHNLDRLLHAGARDAALHRSKVHTLARGIRRSATATNPEIHPLELSAVESSGYQALLDCDVVFSCVDRPWGRAVLNLAAYAHFIPVVDGGLALERGPNGMRGGEWRAHVAAPGRRCLECLGQYDAGLVEVERTGHLDDQTYLQGLPAGHPLLRRENVFAVSEATASAELWQFLAMVIAPGGYGDFGAQIFHFTTGRLDIEEAGCNQACPYSTWLLGSGDTSGVAVTGRDLTAQAERARRAHAQHALGARIARLFDDLLWRMH